MRLKLIAVTLAAIGTLTVMAQPASAQSTDRRATSSRGNTVVKFRDEDGRTRTRVIIERRSYLEPGKEVLPGSRRDSDYATNLANSRPTSVLDNTRAGGNQTALPQPNEFGFGRSGPFLRF